MKVRFLTLAQRELEDAVAWYNGQATGLGLEFLDELDRAVRRAVAFPLSSAEIETGIRRCLLARFPYGLIYGCRWGDYRSHRRGAPTSRTPVVTHFGKSLPVQPKIAERRFFALLRMTLAGGRHPESFDCHSKPFGCHAEPFTGHPEQAKDLICSG